MTNALFQGWTENQMKAEFARATAELEGRAPRRNDAAHRKTRAAAMIFAYEHAIGI